MAEKSRLSDSSNASNSSKSSDIQEASYLDWQPVLTPEQVYQQLVGFSFLSVDKMGRPFWVELRPEEGGRSALVFKAASGEVKEVIPKEFSARSRVFESSGNPYVVSMDWVYFVNFSDQRIYKVNLKQLSSPPIALTTERTTDGWLGKYVDLAVSPNGRWLVFAYEKEIKNQEPINEIGAIDLQHPGPQEARTLASGADFYSSPEFSPDGHSLAWLEWNHPYMPWDSTLLYQASFDEGLLGKPERIAGSEASSIADFCYRDSGELVFAADFAERPESSFENFYNLYGYIKGKISNLTNKLMDFQHIRCSENVIFAMGLKHGKSHVLKVSADNKTVQEIAIEPVSFSAPVPIKDKFYVVGTMAKGSGRILEIDPLGNANIIRLSSEQNVNPGDVSEASAIVFPTQDGQNCYGYYYPPVNSNYRAPTQEKPPVRVLIHGGPTSMTRPGYSRQYQFWTSQGYAIFDVNYRGSVGFGRKYRDALIEKWGLLEIQDVKDGLKYLRERNLVSDQAVVSGGSAGGYTVQRLLTFYPDLFAAGASYFGIGSLVTLQKLTHKFESHYLERLIGGTLATNLSEYEERSPINHIENLKSPMIIFQGSEDKIVPPENSREIAAILKKKGLPYEYYEYPGEDHGFRKKENLVDSIKKESLFFKSTLKSLSPKRHSED